MLDKEICATCLITDVRMVKITHKIRIMYLEVTGLQDKESDVLPCYVCYLCYVKIQRCTEFKNKCLTSQRIFNNLLCSTQEEITKTAIQKINRKALGLESTLSVYHMDQFSNSKISFATNLAVLKSEPAFEDDIIKQDPLLSLDPIKNEEDKNYICVFELPENPSMKSERNELSNVEKTKISNCVKRLKCQTGSNKNRKKSTFKRKEKRKVVDVMNFEYRIESCIYLNKESNINEDVETVINEETIVAESLTSKDMPSGPRVKNNSVENSKVSSLFFIKRMTHKDQLIQLSTRKLSPTYTDMKFKCEHCCTGFKTEIAYKNHNTTHEYGVFGEFQCDICKKYLSSKSQISKHIHTYHFYKYTCKICGQITYTRSTAMFHYQKKHDAKSWKCNTCGKEFRTVHAWSEHKNRIHATVPCDVCGSCFVNKQGVKFHKKYKHKMKDTPKSEVDKKDPLYCEVCQTLFANHDAFWFHMLKSSKHDEDNAIANSRKNASMRTPRVFKTRLTSAVRCSVCDLVIPNFHQACKHYRTLHPGAEPPCKYMCDLCGKTFMFASTFKAHRNTHTKDQTFDCPECSKTFSSSNNLTRHIKMNHTEKNLQCDHCSYKTAVKYDLKFHIQTVHLKIPYLPRIRAEKKRNEKRRKMMHKA